MTVVVAVASGTSADGLDVAVVRLTEAPDAGTDLEILHTGSADWPAGLAERLLALLPPATTTAAEVCALDTAVGQAVGAVAAEAAATVGGADLVVSPGQTVHHEVAGGRCLGTLQLGQPAWVAEATGLPVVSDLRSSDVAAGGHGAPLVALFDALWLGEDEPRAALNLGGIANVTVLGRGPATARDTGPGNCLLDVTAHRLTGRRFDDGGRLAAAGTVDAALLARLRAHPFFGAGAATSTGRETFGVHWLDAVLTAGPAPTGPDLLATLVALTATTVADALAPHAVAEVVASGGGVRNPRLMSALARELAPTRLRVSDELGVPSDAKEAVMWALLGYLTSRGTLGTAGATGARGPRVLGRTTPAPTPAADPPARLRIVR